MAYTTSVRGHVAVEAVVILFPQRIQRLTGLITHFLSLLIFALIGWKGVELAMRSWERGRVIDVINVPLAPFQLVVPLGALAMCLELFVQMFHLFAQFRKGV
jgi:TRAP-type C4-dicarboxylate transport system permease small subunit